MAYEIKMPSAGQTTDDAKIVSIMAKVGDQVKRGDVLLEVETDKAILPVESFATGIVLEIKVSEGDDVCAGSVLMMVGSEKDQASHQSASSGSDKVAPLSAPAVSTAEDVYIPIIKNTDHKTCVTAPPAPAPRDTAGPAMPNAKLLAAEKNVDLHRVVPSNGQFITRKDVLAAATSETAYTVIPLSRARSVIARRMLESCTTIPAWQCTVSVDMTACIALRDTYLEKNGVKLSYNDILAKTIAVAAVKYPLVNARYEQEEIRQYWHSNVGLAVGLDEALLVPVVQGVDEMGLTEISAKYKALVKKARENHLAPSEMGCGSITISNLGMFDVKQFIAIVNPPESCILAVGSIETQPVWTDGAFVPIPTMSITGSFDHRIIDGSYGAKFLREVKQLMENPTLLLS